MRVVEIFKSIDGEGKRAGLPTTFIRLAGCNLRCTYCDSEYAFDVNAATEMSVDDIVHECMDIGIPSITITGGEPLVHPHVMTLIAELSKLHMFDINIETNGTVSPTIYHELGEDVWFTVDYKCPSSGCEDRMNSKAFETLRSFDVLKFVVGSDEDLEASLKVLEKYEPECHIYFSPVFGYDASKIVDFLLEHDLVHCKVQLQLHKYIWDPNRTGV